MNRPIALAALSLVTLAASVEARLTRFVIEKREPSGQFEMLSGRFYGELNPKDSHNAIITDIQSAPRNARGMVEYSATFSMAKPADMSTASGVLIYSVTNRGNGAATASAAGHVSVVSGWQGDVVPRAGVQTIEVPVAKDLTGPVLARFINMPAKSNTLSLTTAVSGLVYQRPLTLDTSKATLNRRASEDGEVTPIASGDWAFADCAKAPFPGTPDASKICAKGGFDPAYLYELVFTAKDPLVMGIGYAATRDLNSFLRYADKDDTGTANPVAKKIQWVVSQGNSQSGNFIRSYIHLGFNQDEAGRIVWDGANPHIAGRQLALNYRFAVGGGIANPYEPGSEAVLWWNDYADKTRHRATAGMLDRCRATKTCPKIFETFGTLEFWELRMSPNLIGTDAKADIPIPDNVRRYYFPGTTHGGGQGRFQHCGAGCAEWMCAACESESGVGYDARADGGSDRLGHEGDGAAGEPLSVALARGSGEGYCCGYWFSCDSGCAFSGWSGEFAARLRFRAGLQVQRSFGFDYEVAACDQAGDSDARAACE